jgi:hypothetical protein
MDPRDLAESVLDVLTTYREARRRAVWEILVSEDAAQLNPALCAVLLRSASGRPLFRDLVGEHLPRLLASRCQEVRLAAIRAAAGLGATPSNERAGQDHV